MSASLPSQDPPYDPRFAPIANPNNTVNLVELGRIWEAHHSDPSSLTAEEHDALDAVLEDPLAARILYSAAEARKEHLENHVRKHGGTVVCERIQITNGKRTVTRTVERHPAKTAVRTRVGPRSRAREHRPGATRRASSSSTTSSADPCDDTDSDSDGDGLRHVSIPLADELNRIAARLRARGGVG